MTPVSLPQGEEKTRQVRAMFDSIATRYEFVNRIMTLGLDAHWRRRCVTDLRLTRGSVVLDVAAGTGDFTRELRRRGYRAVATDLSFGMLSAARGIGDAIQANAQQLPFANAAFDAVTCGYALRNFTNLEATLIELGRVVRPGGRLSILEVAEPDSRVLRIGFRLWFRRVVPLIGSLVSVGSAYQYLPASTAYLPARDDIRSMLSRAGFSAVNHRRVMGGLSQQFLATRMS